MAFLIVLIDVRNQVFLEVETMWVTIWEMSDVLLLDVPNVFIYILQTKPVASITTNISY